MLILTINCGSSSVKYQLYDFEQRLVLAKGIVERVMTSSSFIRHETWGKNEVVLHESCPTHREAIALVIKYLLDPEYGVIKDIKAIKAVGHRVVHGAEYFAQSTIIDAQVLEAFRQVSSLSPLHNPANILGIEAAQSILPDVPHCAIMDTAWHQTMPEASYLYALPYKWYTEDRVRRYGFHGTSFLYTAKRAAVLLGKKPSCTNLIILHIGNGASINAVKDGVSFDTSMGMTPLEGLVMGTRCGDIDPAIIFYIAERKGLSNKEIEEILNKKSGILGITEKYSDRRDLLEAARQNDRLALLALEIETYRLKKYIGAYLAALGHADALVFTAGVGEMNPFIRKQALSNLEWLGIELDEEKNSLSRTRNAETCISKDSSAVKIFVIPTDEEIVMAEDTYALLLGRYDLHTKFTYSFEDPNYKNKIRQQALAEELRQNPALASILALPPSR